MSSLEQRLDEKVFLRVDRSAFVNLKHVKEIRNEGNGTTVVLDNGGADASRSRLSIADSETVSILTSSDEPTMREIAAACGTNSTEP